ncbi:hypothetical protein [Glutamicibacter sp. NPDC087344]|uniref:hypothetical protein n=1 Tax=Glutamicibacter sp. NPDC087344 TaxID=3363994 RepID=UPI00381CE248
MAQKFTCYTAALLTAVAAMLTLSGCFVVPLADGRSPFDDPNGASFADISNALPEIQTALTEANPGGTEKPSKGLQLPFRHYPGDIKKTSTVPNEPHDGTQIRINYPHT